MVIRFNERQVLFQKPLYQVVSEALKASPSTQFELVSLMPTNPSQGQQLGDVVQSLQAMGVPSQQFSARTQQAPHQSYEEVHIYVH